MVIILVGVTAAVIALVTGLPADIGVEPTLHVAGAVGRLQAIDFTFDLNETYTFWSGMLGGLFLALGYFGCDQSQVQRYLSADSLRGAKHSLLMSAFAKIPLQVLILMMGVLVFCFYLFTQPPLLFNDVHREQIEQSGRRGDYENLERQFEQVHSQRRVAAVAAGTARQVGDEEGTRTATAQFVEYDQQLEEIRGEAFVLVQELTGDSAYNDVNYIFPSFITTHLPVGLVGLLIAAIFAAAMSSAAAELNFFFMYSVIDLYKRNFY